MRKQIRWNKRGETESSQLLDIIYLFLGAIGFLLIYAIFLVVLQYFWPAPDTDLIAVNSIANKIEFAMQNIPVDYDQTLLLAVPMQLKKGSSVEFVSPGYENNQYGQICLRQSDSRKDCRTLNAFKIESLAIDQNGAQGEVGVNTGFIYTPADQNLQLATISIHRNPKSINDGSYNINLIVPH